MLLYYVTDSERNTQFLTSDFHHATEIFENTLQELYEKKDYINTDEDFAYFYRLNSYHLLYEAIKTEYPYIEDIIEESSISTLIRKRGWEIDEEATKKYLEETKEKDRDYQYICREYEVKE